MTLREYKMTQGEYDSMLEKITAARNVSGMYLSGGQPMGNVQETANDCWAELARKYGFKPMTARPSPNGDPLTFIAEPTTELNT